MALIRSHLTNYILGLSKAVRKSSDIVSRHQVIGSFPLKFSLLMIVYLLIDEIVLTELIV